MKACSAPGKEEENTKGEALKKKKGRRGIGHHFPGPREQKKGSIPFLLKKKNLPKRDDSEKGKRKKNTVFNFVLLPILPGRNKKKRNPKEKGKGNL